MPATVTIPDDLAEKLRRQAEAHQRSLDEEVQDLLASTLKEERRLTPAEFVREAREMGLSSPDEATAMIREDRDAGHSR
jgi:plasmid stability protein